MTEHTHQCGFDLPDSPSDMAKTEGCGFQWSHDETLFTNSTEAHLQHLCPRCTAGPWTWQYNSWTVQARRKLLKAQKEALEQVLAIERPEDFAVRQGREYLGRITKVLNDERSV